MGFFKSLMKKGDAMLKDYEDQKGAQAVPRYEEEPPTRWEKAVVGLNGIVNQVATIDPNGIDVVCFPGVNDNVDVYRNLTDTSNLKALVTAKEPGGSCNMGEALEIVFKESLERGFEKPTSVLVLTAGRPEDYREVEENIQNFTKNLEKEEDFSVTFVQIGDDERATFFLNELADDLDCTSASGEKVDIVDTVKDEEIKKAMGELKEPGFMGKGGSGALIGGLAGAAMGAGGMYLYNRTQAKKRTEGWNGEWKATQGGEEIAVLNVIDDMQGNLAINGWSDGNGTKGYYTESDDGYNLTRTNEASYSTVYGTVEDEHNISWSDGTHWEEVSSSGQDWKTLAAAGAAGAAVGSGTGVVMQKKFFKKAGNKEPSEYVIVMDRSAMMREVDTGK